jgi:hypothetical protein
MVAWIGGAEKGGSSVGNGKQARLPGPPITNCAVCVDVLVLQAHSQVTSWAIPQAGRRSVAAPFDSDVEESGVCEARGRCFCCQPPAPAVTVTSGLNNNNNASGPPPNPVTP